MIFLDLNSAEHTQHYSSNCNHHWESRFLPLGIKGATDLFLQWGRRSLSMRACCALRRKCWWRWLWSVLMGLGQQWMHCVEIYCNDKVAWLPVKNEYLHWTLENIFIINNESISCSAGTADDLCWCSGHPTRSKHSSELSTPSSLPYSTSFLNRPRVDLLWSLRHPAGRRKRGWSTRHFSTWCIDWPHILI